MFLLLQYLGRHCLLMMSSLTIEVSDDKLLQSELQDKNPNESVKILTLCEMPFGSRTNSNPCSKMKTNQTDTPEEASYRAYF